MRSKSSSASRGELRLADQVLEKRAVMNHRFAQVFGAGACLRVPQGDLMPFAVVLDDGWMLDGNVGGALLKIQHEVAFSGHHFFDRAVRFGEGALGVVDETGLNLAPGILEARALGGLERVDMKVLDARLELFEAGFGPALVSRLFQCSLIFGAEASAIAWCDCAGGCTPQPRRVR